MTHALRFHKTGGPDVFTWEPVDVAAPAAGQIRIRHTVVGLNFIDVYHRTGLYPLELPAVTGMEAVGYVVALGPGVTDFEIGERVGTATVIGAYCEERNVPVEKVIRLPDGISDITAASSLMKGMTAEALVRRVYALRKGDTILFHAAAGGVGSIACQWARALGVRVIGTVSTKDKVAVAKANGCSDVIVTKERNFVTEVKALTGGRGVDVAYDSVGATTFEGSLSTLRARGTLVSFGQSSGKPPLLDIGRLGGERSLFVTRPSLHAYVSTGAELQASAAALFEVLEKGAVKVAPPFSFPLKDAGKAHLRLESRRSTGSTVLMVDVVERPAAPSKKKAAAKKSAPAKALPVKAAPKAAPAKKAPPKKKK